MYLDRFPQVPFSAWESPTRLSSDMMAIVFPPTSKGCCENHPHSVLRIAPGLLQALNTPSYSYSLYFQIQFKYRHLQETIHESFPSYEVPVFHVLLAHCTCLYDNDNDNE